MSEFGDAHHCGRSQTLRQFAPPNAFLERADHPPAAAELSANARAAEARDAVDEDVSVGADGLAPRLKIPPNTSS